eukprot:1160105-Pelagomonas_calceolata.AAC.1
MQVNASSIHNAPHMMLPPALLPAPGSAGAITTSGKRAGTITLPPPACALTQAPPSHPTLPMPPLQQQYMQQHQQYAQQQQHATSGGRSALNRASDVAPHDFARVSFHSCASVESAGLQVRQGKGEQVLARACVSGDNQAKVQRKRKGRQGTPQYKAVMRRDEHQGRRNMINV